MKHCHDILLADANEAFCGLLQESIALRENYRVVRTKRDGIFCALFGKDSWRF